MERDREREKQTFIVYEVVNDDHHKKKMMSYNNANIEIRKKDSISI